MLFSDTLPKKIPSSLPLTGHRFPFPGWKEAPRLQQCFQNPPGSGLTPTPPTSAGAELGQHCELLWQSRPKLTQPVLVNSEGSWKPLTWAASCSHKLQKSSFILHRSNSIRFWEMLVLLLLNCIPKHCVFNKQTSVYTYLFYKEHISSLLFLKLNFWF